MLLQNVFQKIFFLATFAMFRHNVDESLSEFCGNYFQKIEKYEDLNFPGKFWEFFMKTPKPNKLLVYIIHQNHYSITCFIRLVNEVQPRTESQGGASPAGGGGRSERRLAAAPPCPSEPLLPRPLRAGH